ncbi:hypothetical protein [Chishuiella sp.]|uniref:hypothetical protein n=1 Tax=Chishuiella sp. TaxID=1969467 RepID=UPI0028A66A2C|nr:hypothetical protein [Chishuiella sp.]
MKLIFIFFYISSIPIFGQTGKSYKGTINNSTPITFYVEGINEGTYADQIIGIYKYDNKEDYFLLNGYRNNRGDIVLIEQKTVNFSGIFFGKLFKNKITGRWISSNQKEDYNFDIHEVILSKKQIIELKNAITKKTNEFNNY